MFNTLEQGGINMKRSYETPMVQKVAFSYQDQVVAASDPVKNYTEGVISNNCTHTGRGCNIVYTSNECRNTP